MSIPTQPEPVETEKELFEDGEYYPTAREVFATLKRREIYLNLPIHLCILIPSSILLAVLSKRADSAFEAKLPWWNSVMPGMPWSLITFAVLFLSGLTLVWWAYGYLMLKGEGSPASHLGGTTRMVTSGIFSVMRHPSVLGKLMGVVGLGFLFQSLFFTGIIIPLLLVYSLATNRYLQEKYCEEKFGDAYREYRKVTPMIIPRPGKIWSLLKSRKTRAPRGSQREREAFFPGDTESRSFREFQMYMLMLAGIFAVVAVIILLLTR